jgi:hypothetical protein
VRDGGVAHGDLEHVPLGAFLALLNGGRHGVCLAEPCAHTPLAVADDDERAEVEAPTTLDDLGDATDLYYAILELAVALPASAAATASVVPAATATWTTTAATLAALAAGASRTTRAATTGTTRRAAPVISSASTQNFLLVRA